MYKNLENLINTIKILRSPNGCAWDREQTHASLKKNMLEEAYEAIDAIDGDNIEHLKEELGDVLLQVVLHAQIADDEKEFNLDDVAKTINEKLIRRHPHVFGDTKVNSTKDILDNWDKIKKKEKPHRTSQMDGVAKSQPALMSALKISEKAVKVGFEWDKTNTLYDSLQEEIYEFKNATTKIEQEDELGDILFMIVNLARWHKINPELALLKANKKFITRFKMMEKLATKPLNEYSFDEYDKLWENAKKELKKESSK